MNIIFYIDGGVGKCIAATAVCRAIKKAYQDCRLIVVSGYEDVFKNNPNVYRSFNAGNTEFLYDDYFNKDTKVFKTEPYTSKQYWTGKHHLITEWCKQLGIDDDGIKPDLYPSQEMEEVCKSMLNGFGKPTLLLQIIGGPVKATEDERIATSYNVPHRSLSVEFGEEFIKQLGDGMTVIVPQIGTAPTPKGAVAVGGPLERMLALPKYVNHIVCIDSMFQHAAAAYEKEAIVMWGATGSEFLGYETNKNVALNNCPTALSSSQ